MSWLPDWITGYDAENADRAAAADAQLRADNQAKIDEGFYTSQQAAAIRKDYETQNAIGQSAQRGEIQKAFGEGWEDGKKNISGFVSGFFKTISDGLSSVLFGIPAWVWVLGALGIWGWLGFPGLKKLKGKFA